MEEKLRKLIGKRGAWSKADKEYIEPLLVENGIGVPTQENCASCWRDAAIVLLRAIRKEEPKATEGFRMLRGDNGVNGCIFNGRFMSNDVMTQELYDWAVENGFPEHLWQ